MRLSEGEEDLGYVIGDIFGTVLRHLRASVTPLSRVPVLLTVSLPANIVVQESNAHVIVGNQATWIVSAEDLNRGFVAHAVARRGILGGSGNRSGITLPPGITVGLAVLLTVGSAGGIWAWQEKQKADERARFLLEDPDAFAATDTYEAAGAYP